MQFKDYYNILGVEPGAGEAELKTAYRRLARKYHPDVSKESGAEEKFKAVNEAYEALRDPQKRAAYDQLRAQGYRPGEEFRPPPDFGRGGAGGGQGFDFEEVFGSDGANGGFSDFLRRPVRPPCARRCRRGARSAAAARQPGQGLGAAAGGLRRRQRASGAQRQATGRTRAQGRASRAVDPSGRPGRRRRQSAAGNRIRRASRSSKWTAATSFTFCR